MDSRPDLAFGRNGRKGPIGATAVQNTVQNRSHPSPDLENVWSILKRRDGDLIVSKRRMRKAGGLQMVRPG